MAQFRFCISLKFINISFRHKNPWLTFNPCLNSINWLQDMDSWVLRPRHTMRQIAATRSCNKLARVTYENHRCCDRILLLRSVARIQTGLNLCDISQRQTKRK